MDIKLENDEATVEFTGDSFKVTANAILTWEFPVEFTYPDKALPTVLVNSSQQHEKE